MLGKFGPLVTGFSPEQFVSQEADDKGLSQQPRF